MRVSRCRASRARILASLALACALASGCVHTNAVFDETRELLLSREKQDEFVFQSTFRVADPSFFRSLGIMGEGMLPGNDVTILENGDRIFPAMIADIRAAKLSVNM